MPDKLKHLPKVVAILLAFISYGLSAQNQSNNYGKEFRFALLENYGTFSNVIEKVAFTVSFEVAPKKSQPDTVFVRCGTVNTNFAIYGRDTTIYFNSTNVPNAAAFNPNKSILITSRKPISLYALNNAFSSSELAAIIPSEKIPGNPEYYINTYRGDESGTKANNSLFSVVAIDDSVMVNIMPTADSKLNLVKNTPFKILLRKGQVYQEQALDSQSFAGTRVWNTLGCKKFVVFEGAKCSFVDYKDATCSGCDHLYNQSRPLQYLGKKFTTLPYAGMTGGYVYQIVATDNNTAISINGTPTLIMNKGGVYTVNQNDNKSVCIQSDKAISVIELMKSGVCNGLPNNLGNPSLMTVVPDEQMTTKVGFSFPSTTNISQSASNPAEYYIGIVCSAKVLNEIRVNGSLIDPGKFTKSCDLYTGNIKANPSVKYQISSSEGFLAYMYAYGRDESYTSEIGSGFENQATQLVMEANKTSVCDTFHVFKFMAKSDSAAQYNWNFGDGTTFIGDSVSKSYNKTGTFTVRLKVKYPNNAGCLADSVSRVVKVNNRPFFTLGPDTSVCQGLFFKLSPVTQPKVSFLWNNTNTGSSFSVNKDRQVWLTLTDSNLCEYSDTVNVRFVNCDTNSVVIPNVFTPGKEANGSLDLNDLFETRFTGFTEVRGRIFDRWGMTVYNFKFPAQGYWNGGVHNDSSRPCPDGTYYYIYEFVNTGTNFTKTYNGVVQLIR
jgi:hypothetical protein